MAGKQGSANAWILIDGYDLTAYKPKSVEFEDASVQEDVKGLGDTAQLFTPVGLSAIALAIAGGYYDTAAAGGHAALASPASSPQATPRIVCLGLSGQVVGEEYRAVAGMHSASYKVLAIIGELTKANATHVAAGDVEVGQIIQPLAAKTADWNTKSLGTQVDYAAFTSQRVIPITSNSQANPTVITTAVPHGLATGDIVVIAGVSGSSPTINGERTVTVISTTTFSVPVNTSAGSGGTGGTFVRANSSAGGVGHLQVTAASGFTNFVGKLRDSADDVTYADLITFTDNVVAPFAERIAVAGVIDRYLSFDGNVTGSGSITVFCGLSRN